MSYLSNIYVVFVRYLSGICLVFVWYLSGIYVVFVWYLFRILPVFYWLLRWILCRDFTGQGPVRLIEPKILCTHISILWLYRAIKTKPIS